MNRWLAWLMLAVLAGCASSVTRLDPGEVRIRDRMTVRPDGAWNRIDASGQAKAEVWTLDGLPLDSVFFYPGIAEGEALAEPRGRTEKQIPRFRASMEPHEIVELFESSVAIGGNRFKLDRLAPTAFAGGDGFRFDFTVIRQSDELEIKGIGYGAVRGGRLYLMIYRAARIHYFEKHRERVEALARTVEIRG